MVHMPKLSAHDRQRLERQAADGVRYLEYSKAHVSDVPRIRDPTPPKDRVDPRSHTYIEVSDSDNEDGGAKKAVSHDYKSKYSEVK